MTQINNNTNSRSNIDSICLKFKDGLLTFTTFEGLKFGELVQVFNIENDLVQNWFIETRAFNTLDRKSVHQPLHSGLESVDNLISIVLGQKELMIGDRQTGKTTISFDLWQNQTNLNFFLNTVYNFQGSYSLKFLRSIIWIIYVAIGQKRSKVMSIYNEVIASSIIQFSNIVAAIAKEFVPVCMPLQLSELIFTEGGLGHSFERNISLCYRVKLISKKK